MAPLRALAPNTYELINWRRMADTEPMLAVDLGTHGADAARNLLNTATTPADDAVDRGMRKDGAAAKIMKWVDRSLELAVCGVSSRYMPNSGHWEETVPEHSFEGRRSSKRIMLNRRMKRLVRTPQSRRQRAARLAGRNALVGSSLSADVYRQRCPRTHGAAAAHVLASMVPPKRPTIATERPRRFPAFA